jgi:hypothetical protein
MEVNDMLSLNKNEKLMVATSHLEALINVEKEMMLLKDGLSELDAASIIESLMDLAQKKQVINNEISNLLSELQ